MASFYVDLDGVILIFGETKDGILKSSFGSGRAIPSNYKVIREVISGIAKLLDLTDFHLVARNFKI